MPIFCRPSWQASPNRRVLPDELIICDDASTDGTRALLESFASTASIPVSLHFSDQNTGSVKNFERAIGLCTGDVIALSDQDDVWRNDKLELIEQAVSTKCSDRNGLFRRGDR